MCDNLLDTYRDVIFNTPNLNWLLLTKRAPNIKKYLPHDWRNGWDNVWLGVTVENRKHGLRRIDILRNTPAAIRFLSIEPLLEDLGTLDLTGIDWVIVGGESGHKSKIRVMKKQWVMNIKKQCEEQGVPFLFKQWDGKSGRLLNGKEYSEYPVSCRNRPGLF